MTDYAANLAAIEARIADACRTSGRRRTDVELVAVSKGHGPEAIRAFHALGVRDFGESYAQEWQGKADALERDVRWHFIGHLQSNKVRVLADRVALVHSVDRPSLLRELDRRSERPCEILLQLNVGEDPAKSGAAPDQMFDLVEHALRSERLELRGLMTIPALVDDPEATRPVFARLREAGERIRARWPDHPRLARFDQLSMGMTDDFHIAIEEGATLVRVGTALFGART